MKIVFMGTPEFAVPSLKALCENGHEVAAVFTQPDKPVGRKAVITPPPVKVFAQQNGIPVYQPKSVKKAETFEILANIAPDIIVVAAYGKILPKQVLELPPHGCINVHGSLLPAYRGSAPVQWAIINGEKTTGVTTMYMAEGLDTGDILLKSETKICRGETYGELLERLSYSGAKLLVETLNGLQNGTVARKPQNEALATHAPMISKDMAKIDFEHMTARQVENLAAGMNPWPIAHTRFLGKMLKIYACCQVDGLTALNPPGSVIGCANGAELLVACAGKTVLSITELQLEGAKRMPAAQFMRGRTIESGTLLGE